jgi:hypothetical protein
MKTPKTKNGRTSTRTTKSAQARTRCGFKSTAQSKSKKAKRSTSASSPASPTEKPRLTNSSSTIIGSGLSEVARLKAKLWGESKKVLNPIALGCSFIVPMIDTSCQVNINLRYDLEEEKVGPFLQLDFFSSDEQVTRKLYGKKFSIGEVDDCILRETGTSFIDLEPNIYNSIVPFIARMMTPFYPERNNYGS